jgi:hypothetical protein
MKAKTLKLTTLALFPAALLILTSCSSEPPAPTVQTTSKTSVKEGVPGGIVVETHEITATVASIDAANRKVTLATPDGQKTEVKCGPEVVNFDQIRVGDKLKAKVTAELAVAMAAEGAPPTDGGAAVVALSPIGAKPGGVVVNTVQVTAKVTAIDLKRHTATLQFPDGSTRTVAVRDDVDLTKRKVGEGVVIRTTEALAVTMEKP